MAIRTIFSMAEDCARGERLGWLEFVRDFAGIARCLLAHYFPTLVPNLDEHVVAVFRRAGAQTPQRANIGRAGDPAGGAWFSALSFTNEREFMMAFRDLVFAYGREQERLTPQRANTGPPPQRSNTGFVGDPGRAGDPVLPAPEIAREQLGAVMKDLPLLERELLWLFIKGYDGHRITAIMMHAAATAEAVQRIAAERLAILVPGPPPQRSKTAFVGDPGTAPEALTASARVLMELAEQSKTDQCASLKTFNNLVNGQITWRERELTEEHMSNCLYCIDRFTTFREMVRLRKDVTGLAAPQVEATLAQLPFAAAKPRGGLSRLLAGR